MKKISSKYRHLVVAALIAAVLIFVDQLSKRIIVLTIPYSPYGSEVYYVIPYLFNVTHVRNTGAAFSIGADSSAAMTVFIVLTFVCLAAIIFALVRWGTRSRLLFASLCVIFAGAAGNLIDRLTNIDESGRRYVVDFIRFTFWPEFACFNFADICVCVGAVMFVVYFLFIDGRIEKKKAGEKKNG